MELDRKQAELERRLAGKTFEERVDELQAAVEAELGRPPLRLSIVYTWSDGALSVFGFLAGMAVMAWVMSP
jgi:hypothetical protein